MPSREPLPITPLMERSADQVDRAFEAWQEIDLPLVRRRDALQCAVLLHNNSIRVDLYSDEPKPTAPSIADSVVEIARVFEAYLNGAAR